MSEPTVSDRDAFPQRFRRELYRRTSGRVMDLEVRQSGDEIIVSCTVPSYNVKLLVIMAALGSLVSKEGNNVVLDVRVGDGPRLSKGSDCDRVREAVSVLRLPDG